MIRQAWAALTVDRWLSASMSSELKIDERRGSAIPEQEDTKQQQPLQNRELPTIGFHDDEQIRSSPLPALDQQ